MMSTVATASARHAGASAVTAAAIATTANGAEIEVYRVVIASSVTSVAITEATTGPVAARPITLLTHASRARSHTIDAVVIPAAATWYHTGSASRLSHGVP